MSERGNQLGCGPFERRLSRRDVLKGVALVGGAAAFGPLLAACGDDGGSGGESSPAASAAGGSAAAAAAEAFLAPYREMPKFTAPGDPFDAKSVMAGKTILGIPVTSTNPFTTGIYDCMKSIADEVGFTFKVYANQGQTAQWQQGIESGINEGVDLIDLVGGTDPRSLKPSIDAAIAAGIPVVCSSTSGVEQDVPNVSHTVAFDYRLAGEILANWAIWKTGGEGHVLIIQSPEILCTPSEVGGMTDTLDKVGMEYKIVDAPIPEWSTKVQPNVQAAVNSDPEIKYILPIFDSMCQFVYPALQTAGAQDRVKAASLNGTPFVLDMVREGKVEMDIGENLDWIGRAIIDAEMRILGDLEPMKSQGAKPYDMNLPLYLWEKSNVENAGVPAEYSTGYGTEYKDEYRKLWGLI